MMTSFYIKTLLVFVLLVIIQITLIPFLSYRQIAPDLILILLVFFTLSAGQLKGTIMGFTLGLLFDIISGGVIGSAAFSKTLCGFLTGYFYNENKMDFNLKSFLFLAIVLIIGTVDSIVYSFFSTPEFEQNLIVLFFQQGILPALYSAVIALPVVVFSSKKVFV